VLREAGIRTFSHVEHCTEDRLDAAAKRRGTGAKMLKQCRHVPRYTLTVTQERAADDYGGGGGGGGGGGDYGVNEVGGGSSGSGGGSGGGSSVSNATVAGDEAVIVIVAAQVKPDFVPARNYAFMEVVGV
jgi:hypothetical protein